MPERAAKTRQYDLLRPRVGQKEPPRLGSTICYCQTWARLLRPRVGQKKATKTRQYDLLRPNVCQKKPPRLGNTICYGQTWARKSHQDSAVRFVTAKSWPEGATKTRQYDLLRPRVVQKEPPRLGSTICYGQTWARKSHQDSAVRFVTAKTWPEKPPKLGSTICYGQTWARKNHQDSAVRLSTANRKSHRDSAVRFVTAKRGPERATKTRQYDLLRPRVGQKEPPRLGSTICYGQQLARKSHQDLAVRFVTANRKSHRDSAVRSVTAKRGPERATKTRQYDLLRPRVGQKKPPRLGSTICYGQTWARRATKTRQYDLLRPNVGQKEPPRLESHRDSAVRSVTAKRGPERATKTRQYDLLRPRVGQNMPPRLGSTICYGQTWARRATKTRQYDLLRPNVGQKEPPRLGSTICYGQELARKSHQDSAVRFVTAKSWPENATKTRSAVRLVTAKRGPERATKTRQYDFLRPRVGQKEPPRLGSTICYGQESSRKSHQDAAVRFVTAKSCPERATKTRQYDLLRPRVVQKEAPRRGSTICYGQELSRKSHQDSDLIRPRVGQKEPPRLGSTICYGQEFGQKEPPRLGSTIRYGQTCARKSHQDSAVRFVTAKSWPERATSAVRFVTVKRGPERATKTRQYDLLRPNVGQKEPPRLGSTICYGQTWARKSHQDSAVRFVTAKSWPEKATKTRQYDLLRPRVGQKMPPRLGRQYDLLRANVGQKEPPRLGSTICYGQTWARKSHQDSAVRFVTAKRGPERAIKARQYDLLRPNVGQKSHQDSAVRFVTAKRGPERATETRQYDLLRSNVGIKTRQYDLLRPRVGQNTRLGSTMCYGQTWARKSHQDSAVRFVTAKRGPERATKTRQYDLLRPRVGQKEPPRLGRTICYGQELARKSHQDSAVRFVTAKRGPPRLGSTICYGQEWARKSHQDSAVRFVTAKSWPEKSHQDLAVRFVTANRKSHRDSAVRFVAAKKLAIKRATKTRQYDLLRPRVGQKKSHQDSAVRFAKAKSWPERATETRQYDLLRPRVGQKEPPRLGSTICYGQTCHRDSAA